MIWMQTGNNVLLGLTLADGALEEKERRDDVLFFRSMQHYRITGSRSRLEMKVRSGSAKSAVKVHLAREVKHAFELEVDGRAWAYLVGDGWIEAWADGAMERARDLDFSFHCVELVGDVLIFASTTHFHLLSHKLKRVAKAPIPRAIGFVGGVYSRGSAPSVGLGDKDACEFVVAGLNSKKCFLFGRDGKLKREYDIGFYISDCLFVPGAPYMAVAGRSSKVLLVSLETGAAIPIETPHIARVASVAALPSHGGPRLVTGSVDGMVCLLEPKELRMHPEAASSEGAPPRVIFNEPSGIKRISCEAG